MKKPNPTNDWLIARENWQGACAHLRALQKDAGIREKIEQLAAGYRDTTPKHRQIVKSVTPLVLQQAIISQEQKCSELYKVEVQALQWSLEFQLRQLAKRDATILKGYYFAVVAALVDYAAYKIWGTTGALIGLAAITPLSVAEILRSDRNNQKRNAEQTADLQQQLADQRKIVEDLSTADPTWGASE